MLDVLEWRWIDSSYSNKKSPVEIPGRILYHRIKLLMNRFDKCA